MQLQYDPAKRTSVFIGGSDSSRRPPERCACAPTLGATARALPSERQALTGSHHKR